MITIKRGVRIEKILTMAIFDPHSYVTDSVKILIDLKHNDNSWSDSPFLPLALRNIWMAPCDITIFYLLPFCVSFSRNESSKLLVSRDRYRRAEKPGRILL